MTTTGIVRKIDELGRIVLPKELRKYLNINTGDDFQITVNDKKIILERYSRLYDYQQEILKIINCFSSVLNYKLYIVIKNDILGTDNKISDFISQKMQERKIYINENPSNIVINNEKIVNEKIIIYPIVLQSDLLGCIIAIANTETNKIINIVKIIENIIIKIVLKIEK